jgi:hypothetical protein
MNNQKTMGWVTVCWAVLFVMKLGAEPAVSEEHPEEWSERAGPGAGRILLPTPKLARWSIDYQYAPGTAPMPPPAGTAAKEAVPMGRPSKVVVTKSNATYHEETLDQAGQRREKWSVGDRELIRLPGCRTWINAGLNPFDALRSDYSKSEFPGFSWIASRNYLGTQKVFWGDCWVFKSKLESLKLTHLAAYEAALSVGPLRPRHAVVVFAWVNIETRMPVALRVDDEVRIYRFEAPPVEELAPPTEVASQFQQWQKELGSFLKPPPKP